MWKKRKYLLMNDGKGEYSAYIQLNIIIHCKREENATMQDNMDALGDYYAKCNKPVTWTNTA